MTDIVDVIRAVSELVERVFGAPPITKDITEGFDRPCTYVQPTLMQTSLEGGLRHDSYSIEIIRFGPVPGTVVGPAGGPGIPGRDAGKSHPHQ